MTSPRDDDAGSDDSARVAVDAVERGYNPWVLFGAGWPLALMPIAMVMAVASSPSYHFMTVLLGTLGLTSLGFVLRKNPRARRERVRVVADDGDLRIGDRHLAPGTIDRGDVVRTGRRVELHLVRKGRLRIQLEVKDEAEARAILRAIDLDATQSIARFVGASGAHATNRRFYTVIGVGMMTMFAGALFGLAVHPALASMVLMLGVVGLLPFMVIPSFVEVGADGLLVRWLWMTRFVPRGSIRGAELAETGSGRSRRLVVKLRLVDGDEVAIPLGHPDARQRDADALLARIDAIVGDASADHAPPEALVRPPDASTALWVKRLRAGEVASHRAPAPPRERLWRVIEDAAADAVARAAAVIALGEELSESDRARLARVAKRTAAPKLRVVLERAPDAAEEQLEQMIDAVARTAGRAKARR